MANEAKPRRLGRGGQDRALSSVLVALVHARGSVDRARSGPFRRELERSVDAGATKLLVDLSDADDVTTAGMNALLAARQRLLERGGQIAVVLPERLRRRFEVLHLGRRFLLAADRQRAARLLGLVSASGELGHRAPHAHAA